MLSLKERLTEILIDKKLLTKEQLDEAIKVQREKGGKLSEILINLGFINEKDLMVAISHDLGIPPINLSKLSIDTKVLQIIPARIARRYQIIPISKIGNTLSVAMADPLNVFAIDDLKRMTKLEIGPIITTEQDIRQALEQYYGLAAHEAIEELISGIKKSKVELVGEQEELIDTSELIKLTQETTVVKLTNLLLSEGVRRRASDILIEPLEEALRIRYRIDGVLQEAPSPPKTMHPAIVSIIKVMSQLNIAERRLPQDGRFKVEVSGREVDFRISVMPSNFGEKVVLRILDKSQAMLDVDTLGFEEEPLKALKECAMKPHGMILVCGPAGTGKTTTLYSILKYVDSPEVNIVTVEDPVEYELEGINQVSARYDIGLTFANSLRSILRQDPDIIMVGEIRDFDTVDIAIKAALTGHLVLSTLHTTTAAGSIARLLDMGVEPFLITSSLIAVVAQRLVRKICPKCKESYVLSEKIMKEMGIKDTREKPVYYRGKCCEHCFKTGYSGRIGILEFLAIGDEIKNLILEKAQEYTIREAAKKLGMSTLRENGIKKAMAGITSLEEVIRVTAGE